MSNLETEQPTIRFEGICPVCEGIMANENKFCSLKCYETNEVLK